MSILVSAIPVVHLSISATIEFASKQIQPQLLFEIFLVAESRFRAVTVQVRTPVSLVCRILEGVLAYLLYMKYDAVSSGTVAGLVSLGWNVGCVLLAFVLDRRHRRAFKTVCASQANQTHKVKVLQ